MSGDRKTRREAIDRKPHEARTDITGALDDYLTLAREWQVAGHDEQDLRASLAAAENKASDLRKRMMSAKAVLDGLLLAETSL